MKVGTTTHRTPHRLGLAILCLAFLWNTTGCLYVGAEGAFGSQLEDDVIAGIVPGTTTKAEVLALLGPPEEFLRSEVVDSLNDDDTRLAGAISIGNRAHDAYTYQFDTLEGAGTFLILYAHFGSDVRSDLLVIFFDELDVVEEVSFRRGAPQ